MTLIRNGTLVFHPHVALSCARSTLAILGAPSRVSTRLAVCRRKEAGRVRCRPQPMCRGHPWSPLLTHRMRRRPATMLLSRHPLKRLLVYPNLRRRLRCNRLRRKLLRHSQRRRIWVRQMRRAWLLRRLRFKRLLLSTLLHSLHRCRALPCLRRRQRRHRCRRRRRNSQRQPCQLPRLLLQLLRLLHRRHQRRSNRPRMHREVRSRLRPSPARTLPLLSSTSQIDGRGDSASSSVGKRRTLRRGRPCLSKAHVRRLRRRRLNPHPSQSLHVKLWQRQRRLSLRAMYLRLILRQFKPRPTFRHLHLVLKPTKMRPLSRPRSPRRSPGDLHLWDRLSILCRIHRRLSSRTRRPRP